MREELLLVFKWDDVTTFHPFIDILITFTRFSLSLGASAIAFFENDHERPSIPSVVVAPDLHVIGIFDAAHSGPIHIKIIYWVLCLVEDGLDRMIFLIFKLVLEVITRAILPLELSEDELLALRPVFLVKF